MNNLIYETKEIKQINELEVRIQGEGKQFFKEYLEKHGHTVHIVSDIYCGVDIISHDGKQFYGWELKNSAISHGDRYPAITSFKFNNSIMEQNKLKDEIYIKDFNIKIPQKQCYLVHLCTDCLTIIPFKHTHTKTIFHAKESTCWNNKENDWTDKFMVVYQNTGFRKSYFKITENLFDYLTQKEEEELQKKFGVFPKALIYII